MGKWQRGQSGNLGGRPKGVPNKLTMELKEALMAPFYPEKFAKWAEENPGLYFTQILVRLLPRDLTITKQPASIEELIRSLPPETVCALAADIEAQREKEAKPD